MTMSRALFLSLLAASLIGLACASVGRDFPSDRVWKLRIGETTSEEVRQMFGDPWRTGIEDGNPTWTYGKYRYSLFGEDRTKDLVVRFDENMIVRSYTFNTTETEEPKGESPLRKR
ncbi:MAG: outer membrane protein assembly factor BamE [Candidatus Eisenbacteria bacterium]|nr:outer membrane protein assembly factor BamE [Candidatus Eisenbacteria bacterium]